MFRKVTIAVLAALALATTAVLPLQAYPHNQRHEEHYRHVEHRRTGPYQHRMFGSWAQANGWMIQQRQLGYDCYHEWHGPQCFIYYR